MLANGPNPTCHVYVNACYVLIKETHVRNILAVEHCILQNNDVAIYFRMNINGNKANKDAIMKTELEQKCNSELRCTIEKKRE